MNVLANASYKPEKTWAAPLFGIELLTCCAFISWHACKKTCSFRARDAVHLRRIVLASNPFARQQLSLRDMFQLFLSQVEVVSKLRYLLDVLNLLLRNSLQLLCVHVQLLFLQQRLFFLELMNCAISWIFFSTSPASATRFIAISHLPR